MNSAAERTLLYVQCIPNRHEIISSGFRFSEIIQYFPSQIENILIIKGECLGDRICNNFEVVEGHSKVLSFCETDEVRFGDFCFSDYKKQNAVSDLDDQEISELLFLAHMSRPLRTPFYSKLDNHIIYLTHDNGFYGKIYCQDLLDFGKIFCKKIQRFFSVYGNTVKIPDDIIREILLLSQSGCLIDLLEVSAHRDGISLPIYFIGPIENMDDVMNRLEHTKRNAFCKYCLNFHDNSWGLCETDDSAINSLK